MAAVVICISTHWMGGVRRYNFVCNGLYKYKSSLIPDNENRLLHAGGHVIRWYNALWEVNTRLESVCLWHTATGGSTSPMMD